MKKSWRKDKPRIFSLSELACVTQTGMKGIFLSLIILMVPIVACKNNNPEHLQHNESPAKHNHGEMQSDIHESSSEDVYTCPMHPEIRRNEPGTCPICGMDLVKKESGTASVDEGMDSLDFLLKPTYEYVLGSILTIRPETKTINAVIEAPGYLTYDARKVHSISARFGGRIEKLNIRFVFQQINKGQHLLDIYSPEVLTAQQELIFLLENDSSNKELIENARRRLSLLGLTQQQIQKIEKTHKAFLSLPLYSPYSGIILENSMPSAPGKRGEGNEMATKTESGSSRMSAPTIANEGLLIREGMYVERGQRLFNVQSLETVWAILEFYPSDIQSIKTGQSVTINIESFERPIEGKINYIEPIFGEEGKNLRARVYLNNPSGRLKPGTLLKATIQTGSRKGIWIPAKATLDLGRNTIVFVKTNGVFQSKPIQVGIRSGHLIEVKSGITEEDEIAENAQFLIDSESFIKSN